MKRSQKNKQGYFAILSVLLGVLLVGGMVFGPALYARRTQTKQVTAIKTETIKTKSSQELAEKAVEALESQQTQEAVKQAETLVSGLAAGSGKDSLKARITVIKTKMKNKEILAEAERTVVYLEEHPDLSNISLAKKAVAKVTDPAIKKTLENRIAEVQTHLVAKDSEDSKTNERQIDATTAGEEEVIYVTEEIPVPIPSDTEETRPEEVKPSEELTSSETSDESEGTIVVETVGNSENN